MAAVIAPWAFLVFSLDESKLGTIPRVAAGHVRAFWGNRLLHPQSHQVALAPAAFPAPWAESIPCSRINNKPYKDKYLGRNTWIDKKKVMGESEEKLSGIAGCWLGVYFRTWGHMFHGLLINTGLYCTLSIKISLFRWPTPWIGHLMPVTGSVTFGHSSFIPIVGICERSMNMQTPTFGWPYLVQLLEPVEVTINTEYSQSGFWIYLGATSVIVLSECCV